MRNLLARLWHGVTTPRTPSPFDSSLPTKESWYRQLLRRWGMAPKPSKPPRRRMLSRRQSVLLAVEGMEERSSPTSAVTGQAFYIAGWAANVREAEKARPFQVVFGSDVPTDHTTRDTSSNRSTSADLDVPQRSHQTPPAEPKPDTQDTHGTQPTLSQQVAWLSDASSASSGTVEEKADPDKGLDNPLATDPFGGSTVPSSGGGGGGGGQEDIEGRHNDGSGGTDNRAQDHGTNDPGATPLAALSHNDDAERLTQLFSSGDFGRVSPAFSRLVSSRNPSLTGSTGDNTDAAETTLSRGVSAEPSFTTTVTPVGTSPVLAGQGNPVSNPAGAAPSSTSANPGLPTPSLPGAPIYTADFGAPVVLNIPGPIDRPFVVPTEALPTGAAPIDVQGQRTLS